MQTSSTLNRDLFEKERKMNNGLQKILQPSGILLILAGALLGFLYSYCLKISAGGETLEVILATFYGAILGGVYSL